MKGGRQSEKQEKYNARAFTYSNVLILIIIICVLFVNMNKRYQICLVKSLFLCVFFAGIVQTQKTYVFKEFPYKESNKNVCI